MRRCVLVIATMLVLTAGCGETATEPGATPTTSSAAPGQTETVTPTPEPAPGTRGPGDAVAEATQDLARRLGVPPVEVTVVSQEEVTWPDRSLGCPKPGMLYPQVLTDGVRVVLEAQGERYEYHAGGRRPAFLCENPQPPASG